YYKSRNSLVSISNYQIYENKEWTINGIVAQYSSVVFDYEDKPVIETLSFIEHTKYSVNSDKIKCVIFVQNKIDLITPSEILSIALMGTKTGINKFYRVRCPLNKNITNDIFIGTIYLPLYKDLKNSHLIFQKPKVFHRNVLYKM
ncbi:unnamed protein product, partial [Brachionus calyciflorus]